MINRRDFIKKITIGTALVGIADIQLLLAEAGASIITPSKMHDNWDRTIFCIVDNPDLEDALEKCAKDLDCKILFDWPNSPELLFNHHFVAVIDGSLIGEGVWDFYVEEINDGDIKVPCLVVGNAEHLGMPVRKSNIIRFDRNALNSPKDIALALRKIKTRINSLDLV